MSFFRKTAEQPIAYDSQKQEPVVRKSICTGEMTAGFVDRVTGQFQDYMRLADRAALEDFCRRTGVSEVRTIY